MTPSDATLQPNELAELYDSLIVTKQVLENRVSETGENDHQGTQGPYMSLWLQAIHHRVSGMGWGSSPSYGDQQYRRNGISTHEYRENFGNGTRVTRFDAIQTSHPTEREARLLDLPNPNKIHVPVAPDSKEQLPLLVETDKELIEALSLLGEFPDHPVISEVSEPATEESLLSLSEIDDDRRLEEVVVKVEGLETSPGEKKEEVIHVSDIDGESLDLINWSKHEIDNDWVEGNWYWLHQPRVKVWDSSGWIKRKLSSTKNLVAEELGPDLDTDQIHELRQVHGVILTPEARESKTGTQTEESNQFDGTRQNSSSSEGRDDTAEDVVTDIMEDLDLV